MEGIQAAGTIESTGDSSKDPTSHLHDDELLNIQYRMFENIALSSARIKNRQRNEEDLSTSERIKLLTEQFHHSPAVFIERFHPYLCEDDLPCFDCVSDVYEVSFYLKEVRRRLSAGKNSVVVKNRRYEALKKLEKEGTYFSDDEMRARDPLMYEQLIGQYLTDEERLETRTKIDQTDLKFSTILLSFMRDQETKALYKKQQEREEEAEEEEEEEEEEDEEDEEEDEKGGEKSETCPGEAGHSRGVKYSAQKAIRRRVSDNEEEEEEEEDEMMDDGEGEDEASLTPRQPTPATEAEKHLLREEFQNIMRERFLSGGDQDFDYEAVDGNAEYDSLAIRGWDEEEKYFDDEEAADADNGCRAGEQESKDGSSVLASRTDNEELDDYEKWTPEEAPME